MKRESFEIVRNTSLMRGGEVVFDIHSSCLSRFSSTLLREQSVMEKERKARDDLLSLIEGREWIVCETTLNSVTSIVGTGMIYLVKSTIYLIFKWVVQRRKDDGQNWNVD